MLNERLVDMTGLRNVLLGERRRCYCQDDTGHSCRALSRNRSTWRGGQHGGTAWRLLDQRWLLTSATSLYECCTLLACLLERKVAR